MRIFGLEIKRAEKALHAVPDYRGGWRRILEPFTGAWQKNCELKQADILCYPPLYSCLDAVSSDIGKLPFQLKQEDANGIWKTVENAAYSPVLRKPNHYQTQQQFRESWILSKKVHGNTYALKRRDARGVVNALYILDPTRVMPMVSDSGDVFYQLNYPDAANLLPATYPAEQLTIPASEIIHDRTNCFHHQLIGVPPLCAAYWPAVMGSRILRSSAEFFTNNASPAGILTAPAGMNEADATAITNFWNNRVPGRVEVIGADMKFTPFTMTSADAQLVEQLRFTGEQIASAFGIPNFIIGIGSIPAGMKVDEMMGMYYQRALQKDIEAMENLLDEGLSITYPLGVELDLEPLLRMDFQKRADVWGTLTDRGIATPNEGRRPFGLSPLEGGDTVYMQQQDFPLDQVRLNKIAPPEPETPAFPAPGEQDEAANEEVSRALAELWTRKAIDAAQEAMR